MYQTLLRIELAIHDLYLNSCRSVPSFNHYAIRQRSILGAYFLTDIKELYTEVMGDVVLQDIQV